MQNDLTCRMWCVGAHDTMRRGRGNSFILPHMRSVNIPRSVMPSFSVCYIFLSEEEDSVIMLWSFVQLLDYAQDR